MTSVIARRTSKIESIAMVVYGALQYYIILYVQYFRRRGEYSVVPIEEVWREAKAKVIASIWGAKIAQFLAALAVLPRSIWKKRANTSFSLLLSPSFFFYDL